MSCGTELSASTAELKPSDQTNKKKEVKIQYELKILLNNREKDMKQPWGKSTNTWDIFISSGLRGAEFFLHMNSSCSCRDIWLFMRHEFYLEKVNFSDEYFFGGLGICPAVNSNNSKWRLNQD